MVLGLGRSTEWILDVGSQPLRFGDGILMGYGYFSLGNGEIVCVVWVC